MLKIFCLLITLFIGIHNVIAQMDKHQEAPGVSTFSNLGLTDPAARKAKNSLVDYKDIRGNCFWNKDWSPAVVTLKGGYAVKLPNAKLNLYTGEIHYLDKTNQELSAGKGLIPKVVFYDRADTSKVEGVFQIYGDINNSASFIQILNEGKVQLYKLTEVTLAKKAYDPMVGKDEFRFASSSKYFINDKGTLKPIKGIRKASVLSVISSTEEIENWLNANNNKLKSEEDVISFLAFYNSILK